MKKKKTLKEKFVYYFIFILVGLLITFIINFFTPKENIVSYNNFLTSIENEEVDRIYYAKDDSVFTFYLKEDRRKEIGKEEALKSIYTVEYYKEKYIAPNPETDNFKEEMLIKGIPVFEKTSFWSEFLESLPFYIAISIIMLLLRKVPFLKKFLISTTIKKEKPKMTFDDVVGYEETKEELQQIIDFLKNPEKYKKRNANMPTGILLLGPPGVGKTYMSKAIAGEAGVPFYSSTGSSFISLFVGTGAKNIRELYEKARKNEPAIVFIDEIDSVGQKRKGNSSGHDEHGQTINQLLAELDGYDNEGTILTIATTNRASVLDEALVRPGRFDKHIKMGKPVKSERVELFEMYLRDKPYSNDISIEKLASDTSGSTAAFIEALVNESLLTSIRNNHEKIKKEDIEKAIFKVSTNGYIRKRQPKRDEEDIEQLAYHEVGHAFYNYAQSDLEVKEVNILESTSGSSGVTIMRPNDKEENFFSKKDLENRIKSSMAGRVAEEIYTNDFNKVWIGAGSDIESATELIKKYITHYSFSEKSKFISMKVLNTDSQGRENVDRFVTSESIKLANKFYEETKIFLKKNKEILKIIVEELIKKERLYTEDLEKLIKDYKIEF